MIPLRGKLCGWVRVSSRFFDSIGVLISYSEEKRRKDNTRFDRDGLSVEKLLLASLTTDITSLVAVEEPT